MDLNNKAELKKVWVDALRSGNHKQTSGTLHNLDDGGSCCLGVAAEVWGLCSLKDMGVHMEEADPEYDDVEGPKHVYEDLRRVIEIAELIDKGIEMNDNGVPFTEIADMIERDWHV